MDDVMDYIKNDVIYLNTDKQNYSSEKVKFFQYEQAILSTSVPAHKVIFNLFIQNLIIFSNLKSITKLIKV